MAAVMFFWICPKGYAREQVELGSIDFDHRGLSYHIWEFEDNGVYGAETNLRISGRSEDLTGDYEEEMIQIMKTW